MTECCTARRMYEPLTQFCIFQGNQKQEYQANILSRLDIRTSLKHCTPSCRKVKTVNDLTNMLAYCFYITTRCFNLNHACTSQTIGADISAIPAYCSAISCRKFVQSQWKVVVWGKVRGQVAETTAVAPGRNNGDNKGENHFKFSLLISIPHQL